MQNNKYKIPTNKNIFIWCNYRTGSTALTGELSKVYNLKNYCEAFQPLRPADTEKFLKEIKTIDQNYVVKVMPGQTEDKFKVEIEEITADSHVILLERKNKIDQMASMYVAQTTGVWLEMDGDQQDTQEFSLDIDKDEVSKVCDEIAHNHQLLKTKQYHQKLFYEDIELKDTGFRKQLKPTNYEDIKKEIYFYAFENLPELLEN
jgi:hypothetical protein